ncbi:MAG: DUF1330 domain-containing protein [Acidobacteria bacterium]|nr:DUF1330 domain-containing protein [Acidobacteriota bacterium]
MAYERLVGLDVADEALYQEYRDRMRPILASYGGGFGYDFRIAETLQSRTDAPINRVFTLYFPDEAAKDRFFGDPAYKAVRAETYDKAVRASTILATYERPD